MVLPQMFGCKMVQGDGSGVRSAEMLKAKLEAIAAHPRMQRESKGTVVYRYHIVEQKHNKKQKRIHIDHLWPTKEVISIILKNRFLRTYCDKLIFKWKSKIIIV